jgi:hypothetical protein
MSSAAFARNVARNLPLNENRALVRWMTFALFAPGNKIFVVPRSRIRKNAPSNDRPDQPTQRTGTARLRAKAKPMKWYAQLIGYGFPVILGILLMRNVVERLWDCISPNSSKSVSLRPETWQPRVLAFLESVLYIAFLQLGQAWFIAAWLALKTAGQWQRWGSAGDDRANKPPGHVVFNVFLIGNGFLVLYCFVGYKMIGWIDADRWLRAFWAPSLIVGLTIAFYFWLARFRKPSA